MNCESEEKYADIINLPHHVSHRYPQMSMADRAAQFSPFAALTGHDAAIAEAARLTEERPVLDEEDKLEISNVIQEAASHPYIALNVVYFVPDARKSGGSYAEACGTIKKLEPIERLIILNDGTRIPIDDIVEAAIISQ